VALETEVTSSGRQFRVFGDDGLGKLEGLSFYGVAFFVEGACFFRGRGYS